MAWSGSAAHPISNPYMNRMIQWQMGVLSPLWSAYAGMAAMGAATWSMSRWMRPATPEAPVESAPAPAEVAALLAPVEAQVEVEIAADPVADPVAEASAPVAHRAEAAAEQVSPVPTARPAARRGKPAAKPKHRG